jgi:outer membrane protein assembly factor BamA
MKRAQQSKSEIHGNGLDTCKLHIILAQNCKYIYSLIKNSLSMLRFNVYALLTRTYKKFSFLLILVTIFVYGCNTTRFVPENEYLLDKVVLKCDNRKIDTDDLYGYVQQKSNKKVLYFLRLHLHIYNTLCNHNEKGPIHWIGKTVGEKPVVYDRFLTQKTINQLEIFLANKGYYNAEVKDSLGYNDRAVTLYYIIRTNAPYTVKSINYQISNPTVAKLILSDTANSNIKTGNHFDINLFDLERQRITRFLKEQGYYYFNVNSISYTADTTIMPNQVDVISKIGYSNTSKENAEENNQAMRPCYIRKVIIYPSFDPKRAIIEGDEYINSFDSTTFKDYLFLQQKGIKIKHDVILKALSISQGDKYNIIKVEETSRFLNSTAIFKLINIRFNNPENLADTAQTVECIIQLTPHTIQSYTVELEGNNSGNNYEAAVNLSYQHRNIFNGAEILNLKVTGAAQIVTEGISEEERERFKFNSYEYGAEANIDFPNFLIPFGKEYFYKKYRPKTSTGGAYSFHNQPNYTRTILKGNFGYFWNGSQNIRHIVTPIELNSVRFPVMDSAYLASNPYRRKDFDNYFISSAWYSIIFSNQQLKSIRNYVYFRYNIELAGNLMTTAFKLTKQNTVDGSYVIDPKTKIAQFAKTDIDFRYYYVINQYNRAVLRIFTGIGVPYGNVTTMPFVKQFSAGGANDVRAWQIGRLGPGTFADTTLFPNQTSNFKLIGNFEYRFHLVWKLEGAFFVDAGNIWSINKYEQRENTKFKLNSFYKEFAVGSGLGLRLDLNFLLIRLDGALKVKDPSIAEHYGIIPFYQKYTKNDFQIHIGIGYPF